MAVMPAVFAAGLEPGGGPNLLFVSLQTVFNSMGGFGPFFGFLFYALVFFAALTSSIGMMEGGVSAMLDAQEKREEKTKQNICNTDYGRFRSGRLHSGFRRCSWKFRILEPAECSSRDRMRANAGWMSFDLGAEGILMPLGGLLMAIMLGWTRKNYITDEVRLGGDYRSQGLCKSVLQIHCTDFHVPAPACTG